MTVNTISVDPMVTLKQGEPKKKQKPTMQFPISIPLSIASYIRNRFSYCGSNDVRFTCGMSRVEPARMQLFKQ